MFIIIYGALLRVKVEFKDGTALGILFGTDDGIIDGIYLGKVLSV